MEKVGVYGSLRKGMSNSFLLEGAEYICSSRVPNFKMISLGGFPAVDKVADPNESILVEFYYVDDDILEQLDYLEGYRGSLYEDNFYERIRVTHIRDNDTYMYIMPGCLTQYEEVHDGDWTEFVRQARN